jgi:hypothetical protein
MLGDITWFLVKLDEIIADVVELVLNVVRFVTLGTVFGGIRDAWQAEDLRDFVIDLLGKRFANNPPTQARIRANLGLDGTGWGFPMKGTHRVMRLDSGTAPLWQWHKDGKIDLYAMAGLTSFDSFNVRRTRTVVRSTNPDGSIEGTFPSMTLGLTPTLVRQKAPNASQVFTRSWAVSRAASIRDG